MYSLHSVCRTLEWKAALRNVCSGGCLSQLLDLFFRTIRWQSVFLLPRERDSGRPGGHWARAIPPSLVWTSVMRPLHYNYNYTLHLYIYITPHDIRQWENCQLQNSVWFEHPLIKVVFKFHRLTRLIAKTCFQKVLKLMNNDFIPSSHAMNFNFDWGEIGP